MIPVDVVLTACGRLDLLKKTITSFNKFNTYPINNFIIVEDSGEKSIHQAVRKLYPNYTIICNEENIGLVRSIDRGYFRIKSEYFFHCEEDWEFYRHGFIERSLEILQDHPEIMQVWLRELNDTNGHPIEENVYCARKTTYRMVAININGWHGFTWNPGLRRLSDYIKVGPFNLIAPEYGKKAGYREMYIGQEFFKYGYRAAILTEGYCKHIGYVSKKYSLT